MIAVKAAVIPLSGHRMGRGQRQTGRRRNRDRLDQVTGSESPLLKEAS